MTSVPKNVYIEKLYINIIIHIIVQLNHVMMQSQANTLILIQKGMMKIFNLKLMIILKYRNIKTFLQKVTLQISPKKFL